MPFTAKLPLLSNRVRKISSFFLCTLCLVLVLAQVPVGAQTQINRATLTQVLDSPQVYIQNKLAKVNDSATRGQRVRTGQARAQLRFNTGAIGRMARNSVLTVGQRCAQLQQGSILVNGAVNGCTNSVVAGVRGTTYVMEVSRTNTAEIRVLEGEVVIQGTANTSLEETPTPSMSAIKQWQQQPGSVIKLNRFDRSFDQPSPARNQPILQAQNTTSPQMMLRAGDKVAIGTDGALAQVQKMARAEYTKLLAGDLFKGYKQPLPSMSKIQQSFQALYPGEPFPNSVKPNAVRGLW